MIVPRHYFKYAESMQEREALEALNAPERYPFLAPPGRLDMLVCQLGLFPTFTALKTWALVHKQAGYFVRRVVWSRFGQTPELSGTEALLPTESVRTLLSELRSLNLPLDRPEPDAIGRDGDTHSLTISRLDSELALSWWQEGPPGWKPLTQWHEKAVALFEAHLPPTH